MKLIQLKENLLKENREKRSILDAAHTSINQLKHIDPHDCGLPAVLTLLVEEDDQTSFTHLLPIMRSAPEYFCFQLRDIAKQAPTTGESLLNEIEGLSKNTQVDVETRLRRIIRVFNGFRKVDTLDREVIRIPVLDCESNPNVTMRMKVHRQRNQQNGFRLTVLGASGGYGSKSTVDFTVSTDNLKTAFQAQAEAEIEWIVYYNQTTDEYIYACNIARIRDGILIEKPESQAYTQLNIDRKRKVILVIPNHEGDKSSQFTFDIKKDWSSHFVLSLDLPSSAPTRVVSVDLACSSTSKGGIQIAGEVSKTKEQYRVRAPNPDELIYWIVSGQTRPLFPPA